MRVRSFSERTSQVFMRPRPRNRRQSLDNGDSSVIERTLPRSESTRIAKCFWVVLITISIIGFVINFNSVLRRYLQEPILTQINDDFADFVWPHITFCNPSNPIAFWKGPELKKKWFAMKESGKALLRFLKKNNISVSEEELLMSSISPKDFFEDGVRGIVYKVGAFFHVTKKIAASSGIYDSYETIKTFDVVFHDHLESSKFPLPCYTLKPELIYPGDSAKLKGIFAVRVVLLLDSESYRLFDSGYQNRKMYMYLNYPNDSLSSTNPMLITPGTTSHFQLTETHLERIKNCTDHNQFIELYRVHQHSSRPFKGVLRDCRFNISQRLYYEVCKCQTPSLPIYKLSAKYPPLCLNMTLFNSTQILSNIRCIHKVRRRYSSEERFDRLFDENCSVYFKTRCSQISYSLRRRTINWPKVLNKDRRKKLLKHSRKLPNAKARKSIDDSFARNNIAVVHFHRTSAKSILTFDQWEYPMSEFLSDVGGLLGLWLGMSVVGVYQIIEHFILHGSSMIKGLQVRLNDNDHV